MKKKVQKSKKSKTSFKTLSKKTFLEAVFFIGLLFFVFTFQGGIRMAKMDSNDNMAGWAWSENIGWISFNCENEATCATSDYGVDLNPAGMNISGYAWSDVGWISFETTASTTPDNHSFSSHCIDSGASCIDSSDCIACYNPDDSGIYGWARILALGDDGWISLNCENEDTCGTADYGLSVDKDAKISGWAYNGADIASTSIGWISFNCIDRGVCGSTDYETYLTDIHFPEAHNLSAPNWDNNYSCSTGATGGFLTWDIYDEDDNAQGYYQIIINDSNSTSSPIVDTGKISSGAEQYYVSASGVFDYDTPYYWWVKIWDEFGFPSELTQFDVNINTASSTHELTDNIARNTAISPDPDLTFTPFRHEFPDIDFSYVPDEILKGQIATFTASSTYFTDASPSSASPCDDAHCSYVWSGSDGVESITSSTEEMTEMVFKYSLDPSISTTSITLEVTDNEGYVCSSTQYMFVDLLPNWKEIKPE